jgi:hypothetical protein
MFRVLIRKHKNEAIVRPPFEFLEHGDKLQVKNGTKDDIVVTVPDGVFKPAPGAAITSSGGHVVPSGKTLKLTIKSDAEDGAYSYSIFCKETHTYAQANSDPEFIVE